MLGAFRPGCDHAAQIVAAQILLSVVVVRLRRELRAESDKARAMRPVALQREAGCADKEGDHCQSRYKARRQKTVHGLRAALQRKQSTIRFFAKRQMLFQHRLIDGACARRMTKGGGAPARVDNDSCIHKCPSGSTREGEQ